MSRLLKFIIVLATTFSLLEISSRVFYDKPWLNGYSFDKFTGAGLTPGTNGWWTREGRGFVEINSRGMRDNREYENSPKNDVYRVAIVGDSYVEAVQVNVSEAFWRLMEVRLNSECSIPKFKEFEVLPFGVSGHGPAQYLLNIENKISKIDPNLVLILFTPGNDFRNSVESLERDPLRPYLLEISETKKLYEWDFSFRKEPYGLSALKEESLKKSALSNILQATDQSQFLSLIQEIKLRIKTAAQRSSIIETNGKNENRTINLGDNYMYLPYEKLPNDWKKSRRVVEQIIYRMGKLDKSNYRVLGVIGTSGPQIHPSIDKRNEFINMLGVNNLKEPSDFFRRTLRDAGIESIDLLPELSRVSIDKKTGMHGEAPDWGGHWNTNGHLEVAKILSKEICGSIKAFNK